MQKRGVVFCDMKLIIFMKIHSVGSRVIGEGQTHRNDDTMSLSFLIK
jgi:hypothetical protein